MSGLPMLTILTLLPLAEGLIALAWFRGRGDSVGRFALGAAIVNLVFALAIAGGFDTGSGDYQFLESHAWIPSLGVDYVVGVDGLGLLMVVLTGLVVCMAVHSASGSGQNSPLFYALVFFLQTGLFGTFTALNFVHWFLFWEIGLIPAFFLVKLWGGANRSVAAMQFFIYTMVGSVAMLLAFLAIRATTGVFDFSMLEKAADGGSFTFRLVDDRWVASTLGISVTLIFVGVFLGLAVKVPSFPFHTWLPGTYSEAPSAVTMLLTGVMSKMGVYGFVRILLPLFHETMRANATMLLSLAVATIVLSAFAAWRQKDLKRMLAYSSINHLGYCLLAVFAVALTDAEGREHAAAALNGVFLQMFNHGLTAATLFALIGMLEDRSDGLRGMHDFGGLRAVVPFYSAAMGVSLFSSLGLPGLNGFVGEFLIFRGVFAVAPWAAALSTIGLLITAVFLLAIVRNVFAGPLNERWKSMPDLSRREVALIAPAIGLMIAIGCFPQILVRFTNPTVNQILDLLNR